jgi:hypothetical protein
MTPEDAAVEASGTFSAPEMFPTSVHDVPEAAAVVLM